MKTETRTVIRRYQVDVSGFKAGLNSIAKSSAQAAAGIDRVQQSIEKAGQSAKRVEGKFDKFGSAARIAIGAIGARELGTTLLQLESMDAMLKAVTVTQEGYSAAIALTTRLADQYGKELKSLTAGYVKYYAAAKAAGTATKDIERIFTSLITVSTAYGLTTATLEQALFGLQQVAGGAQVTLEDIRQVVEPLPGGFALVTKAVRAMTGQMQLTDAEVKKLISDGQILRDDLLPALATEFEKTGTAATASGKTAQAELNRLKNALTALAKTIAESGLLTLFSDWATGASAFVKDLTALSQLKFDNLRPTKDVLLSATGATAGAVIGSRFGGLGALAGAVIGSGAITAPENRPRTLESEIAWLEMYGKNWVEAKQQLDARIARASKTGQDLSTETLDRYKKRLELIEADIRAQQDRIAKLVTIPVPEAPAGTTTKPLVKLRDPKASLADKDDMAKYAAEYQKLDDLAQSTLKTIADAKAAVNDTTSAATLANITGLEEALLKIREEQLSVETKFKDTKARLAEDDAAATKSLQSKTSAVDAFSTATEKAAEAVKASIELDKETADKKTAVVESWNALLASVYPAVALQQEYAAAVAITTAAEQENIATAETAAAVRLKLQEQMAASSKAIADQASAWYELNQAMESALASSANSWMDQAFEGTFKLKNALKDLAKELAKVAVKMAAMKLINAAVSGYTNYSADIVAGGTDWMAKGNAFTSTNQLPQGVYTQPTKFLFTKPVARFARGTPHLGVLGEAGPEAIMPLRKGGIRAKLPSGLETSVPLTRMVSGHLGINLRRLPAETMVANHNSLTKRFATGNVFNTANSLTKRFATGNVFNTNTLTKRFATGDTFNSVVSSHNTLTKRFSAGDVFNTNSLIKRFATGNVFNTNSLIKRFATGDVFNSTTFNRFATGDVFNAAPVTRVGTNQAWPAPQVNVNVSNQASDVVDVSTVRNPAGDIEVVISRIVNDISRGGNSTSRAFENAYALNRAR